MRIRPLFFCLPLLALLAACAKTDAPVRLDFVGATGLLSGNRTVGAGDTLVTHAYAVGNDKLLKNLRIEVSYTPGPTPILYPIPTSSFDAANAPKALTLVYLDSVLSVSPTDKARGGEFLFVNGLMARTTSGQETWTYTATDQGNQMAARRYRLTVRKTDSAAVFHNYSLVLRPVPRKAPRPASVRDARRVYLSLRYGLLLPRHAVLNNTNSLQANQAFVDLIAVADAAGTAVSLVAPADASFSNSSTQTWPLDRRRATEVHATGLTTTQFANAATTAGFVAAFNASKPYEPATGPATGPAKNNTGPLTSGQVIAFKAFDDSGKEYYGLLQVTAFTGGTNPLLTCLVKVQK